MLELSAKNAKRLNSRFFFCHLRANKKKRSVERTLKRMFIKSLLSSKLPLLRCFSSLEPRVLTPGDILRRTRIYSSEDVLAYSKVSQDANPLHFDSESARAAGFDDRLVHGMLVAALFPQIISSHFPGAVYVFQSLHFRLPVYVGDKVLGELQAINVREIKKRYLVKFSTKCVKNGEILVLDGEATAILPTLTVHQAQSMIDTS